MYINKITQCATAAKTAADFIKRHLPGEMNASTAVVLGTGLGDAIPVTNCTRITFNDIPGFHSLGALEGHARELVYGFINDTPAIILRGRIHLNEDPTDPGEIYRMVRLQTEMLAHLGINKLIVTCAVGFLPPVKENGYTKIKVHDIVAVDGLVTLFAPPMPLFGGEFKSPEDALYIAFRNMAYLVGLKKPRHIHTASHAMVLGPFFEGRKKDKKTLAKAGASVVGMSLLPECCVAKVCGMNVLALGFVTNGYDEIHSHETNQKNLATYASENTTFLQSVFQKVANKKILN